MFRWYVINTYSGHENKVKANLEHRVKSMNQEMTVRRVVVPTESVVETKDGQKVQTERRLWPGYVLVNMDLTDEAWTLVKNTPGVTGFVGAQNKPVPLSQPEVDRMLLFRDWLRSNPSDRQLYERTKRELARKDWKYTQNYADAKTEVVEEILARTRGDDRPYIVPELLTLELCEQKYEMSYETCQGKFYACGSGAQSLEKQTKLSH